MAFPTPVPKIQELKAAGPKHREGAPAPGREIRAQDSSPGAHAAHQQNQVVLYLHDWISCPRWARIASFLSGFTEMEVRATQCSTRTFHLLTPEGHFRSHQPWNYSNAPVHAQRNQGRLPSLLQSLFLPQLRLAHPTPCAPRGDLRGACPAPRWCTGGTDRLLWTSPVLCGPCAVWGLYP